MEGGFPGAINRRLSVRPRLAERRQFHQIVLRNRFQMASSLSPRGQAAYDYERVEAFFLQ
jgi:hypothetical protein